MVDKLTAMGYDGAEVHRFMSYFHLGQLHVPNPFDLIGDVELSVKSMGYRGRAQAIVAGGDKDIIQKFIDRSRLGMDLEMDLMLIEGKNKTNTNFKTEEIMNGENSAKSLERATINSLINNLFDQNQVYMEALGKARAIESKLEDPEPEESSDSEKEREPTSLLQRLTVAVRHYKNLNNQMHNKLESIGRHLE